MRYGELTLRPVLQRLIATWLALAALGLAACAAPTAMVGRTELNARAPEVLEDAPLAGEALVQRKIEMRRSFRDLVQFGATMETLRLRRDRAMREFQDFVTHYVETNVDPLLDGRAVSEDPELAVLDAELRLVKAELWIETNDYWSAGDMIDDIEERYGERRSMLVRYPVGRQSTLREALDYLHERNRGVPGQWTAPNRS